MTTKALLGRSLLILAAAALGLAALEKTLDSIRTKEDAFVPDWWIGKYGDWSGQTISLSRERLQLDFADEGAHTLPSILCQVERVSESPGGILLFKGRSLRVVCDKESTDRRERTNLAEWEQHRPGDFRMSFFLEEEDTSRSAFARTISVSMTQWGPGPINLPFGRFHLLGMP